MRLFLTAYGGVHAKIISDEIPENEKMLALSVFTFVVLSSILAQLSLPLLSWLMLTLAS